MKTKLLLFWLIAMYSLPACKKGMVPTGNTSTRPSNFKELKASNNFRWSVINYVTFSVKGIKTPATVKGLLSVRTTDGKTLLYSTPYQMDKDHTSIIKIPARIKEVMVQYGSIKKNILIANNIIAFDCLPNLPIAK